MVNRSLPIQKENRDIHRLTGNLIFKKSEIVYELEKILLWKSMGFHEVHLKYDHTFPIMQLIEQLVNRELVVYHEEEWQNSTIYSKQYDSSPNYNHNKYVVHKYYNIFVMRHQ
jgi:hypothetical protein